MRIVAGTWRGRTLQAPPGDTTRPTADRVRQALTELPLPCQRAFWMHRAQGATVAEIASELHVTERMVRHHLSRALVYCQLRIGGASEAQAKERLKR